MKESDIQEFRSASKSVMLNIMNKVSLETIKNLDQDGMNDLAFLACRLGKTLIRKQNYMIADERQE